MSRESAGVFAPDTAPTSRGRSVGIGSIAGAISLGCCLYPIVLVLLGLSTASAALDLGNRLLAQWGWAFKLSGALFAVTALWLQRRRARACPIDQRPRLARNAAITIAVAMLTYGVLYASTTWLGSQAT